IDCSKLKDELCWQKAHDFEDGLQRTVQWYVENKVWIENIQSGEYRKWIETNYGQR
ncbi:MAG TPA: dTDP-glucose 4,6-dehydratase, partial [Rectinema sp.]|nr:dTDP-glucose 4,6-dehydratase [Rectinema sp.]